MAGRDRLLTFIDKLGRTVRILRDAGNISDKYAICRVSPNTRTGTGLDSYQEEFFKWNSDIRVGDIFQDMLTEERHLVLGIWKVGVDSLADAIRVGSCRANDTIILYEIVKSNQDEYGKYVYNLTVRLNDYANIFHSIRPDSLTPIGEMSGDQLFIIFSARKFVGIATYIPKSGDQIVLANGSKFQIDSLDAHIYPGSYRALCSPDQRI